MTHQTILEAIADRIVLQFHYDGGLRIVEPFCYGVSTTGKQLLRAYQSGGYSSSGTPEGWRLFDTTKMSEVITTGEGFSGERPGYQPNDSAMVRIHARV